MSDLRCTYCMQEGHRASHCPVAARQRGKVPDSYGGPPGGWQAIGHTLRRASMAFCPMAPPERRCLPITATGRYLKASNG